MWEKKDIQGLVKDALARKETLVLGVSCEINYSGRAESQLARGDRIIIIKTDGALLVHQPLGNAPVNYMKPGTAHTVHVEKDQLVLKSENLQQKEFLDVFVHKVHFFNSHKLEDGQKIILQGNEADMADMLYKQPDLIEKGFKAVSQEEQTKYGYVDVLGVDKDEVLTVVECKRYCADLAAVTQLRRYVERLMASKGLKKVRGILAAPKITANAQKMLEDWGYAFVSVEPPKYLERYNKSQKGLGEF
ncbi:MAG: endonuclease NucS [Candidatus Woesearchaeota archaeon]|jgi:hypothetical protein|nr:endonuclease NucS [Candidatus Woesearchaeota archaeon]MDP7199212.1 endonuclease NucS [Candidatus Woesearchaeota archaeon]MDP7467825.1 endonuclease NucS [Candidatus Woesearchaeota archaeon]MDP7647815.1 endonuclease NucS [Candidatus Woesearchaeota archaeon]